jgi:hypothetical protein
MIADELRAVERAERRIGEVQLVVLDVEPPVADHDEEPVATLVARFAFALQ